MIKPVNNQVLIEVLDEYAGLTHNASDGQKGIVKAVTFSPLHLTASTGLHIKRGDKDVEAVIADMETWVSKTVRYALYADADSSRFQEDGKDYVLIPWYRILGIEA